MAQSGWDIFWQGADYQVAPEYTDEQQAARDAAFKKGQAALSGYSPEAWDPKAMADYYESINPSAAFTDVMSPEAMEQYAKYAQGATATQAGNIMDLAGIQSRDAASQAAERFNLSGPGGLYSGGAAAGVAQGAATPIAQANVDIAGIQSKAYQDAMAQNMAGTMAGYDTIYSGMGNVFGMSAEDTWKRNTINAQLAANKAQLYGTEASMYDTEATYGTGTGALDFMNTAFGGINAATSLWDLFNNPNSQGV